MQCHEVLEKLKSWANPEAVAGMARYGINPTDTYGVSMPKIRMLAKQIGRNHLLAQQLWSSGIHEARILASLVDDAAMVDQGQMERWVGDFDSWDICDQCCGNLFDKTRFAYQKAVEWSARDEEFVKRAGFVLMAGLAVHDKKADDAQFVEFLPIIALGATDERNFVKKAVNWALRQIGKRSLRLNGNAIGIAKQIHLSDSRAARWIATDALRELTSEAVQARLRG